MTIIVKYPILGNKVRLFREDDLFVTVYDWIESLNSRPKHFKLQVLSVFIPPETLVLFRDI